MPRTTFLYLAAVLLPCAVLAWLGWHSAGQEAAAARARRIAGWQQSADAAAQRAQAHMERRAREFGDAVESLAGRAERSDPGRTASWLHSRSAGGEAVFVFDTSSGALEWADGEEEFAARDTSFLRGAAEAECALVAFGEPLAPSESLAGVRGSIERFSREERPASESAVRSGRMVELADSAESAEILDSVNIADAKAPRGGLGSGSGTIGGESLSLHEPARGLKPEPGAEMEEHLRKQITAQDGLPAPGAAAPAPLPDELAAAAKQKFAVVDTEATLTARYHSDSDTPGAEVTGRKESKEEKTTDTSAIRSKAVDALRALKPETDGGKNDKDTADTPYPPSARMARSAPAEPAEPSAPATAAPSPLTPAPASAPIPTPTPAAAPVVESAAKDKAQPPDMAAPAPVGGTAAPVTVEAESMTKKSEMQEVPALSDAFANPPADAPATPVSGKAVELQPRASDPVSLPAEDSSSLPPPAPAKPASKPAGLAIPDGRESVAKQPEVTSEFRSVGRQMNRTIEPVHATPGQPFASSVPLIPLRFSQIAGASRGGIVASRLEEGALRMIFWHRPSWQPQVVVGMLMSPQALLAELQSTLPAGDGETQLRLAGHGLEPAGAAPAAAPVVSREIGPALPLWEAAVFLTNPAALTAAGNAARWQLALTLLAVLAAGVAGAMLLLRDARRAATDARQKVDFVSSVSHELKTPLTSIRMFSDLLATQPDAPAEKRQRYARTIAAEAARLSRLIGNVLNFARLERGAHRLNPERLDVRELCTRTVESMAPALEQDGFSVAVMLPEEPVMITADQDALSQILVNLLSNAQKYGKRPDSAESGEISLTLSATPDQVLLSVADRGPGVPAGQEEKIFRQFHRADDAMTSGASGSGLGLTISRGLARAHGGNLTCSARDGGGAVFRLALPLHAGAKA